MQKLINIKPLKKVRIVERPDLKHPDEARKIRGDIDDMIFADETSVPSER